MRNLGKVYAHIPARAGSKRVKAKNLRLLDGKPMLQYAIEAAKESNVFDEVFVNSDSDEMLVLAKSLGANGYKRSDELASDTATGDEFTIDFIRKMKPDTLVMISPVCPLVTAQDIKAALDTFSQSACDTLITCDQTQMQTFCENKPVNIDLSGQLAPTQQNPCVETLNWAVTVWDAAQFVSNFESTGSAYIGKQRVLMPISPLHAIKISHEPDFEMAEQLLKMREKSADVNSAEIQYWSAF